ncbi:hypothetical protein EVAR_45642_1 [Eumeta japonica]|uniref:Uncharacterized protein n=1 Tax=Eumeta variegata TaxID=151549 RepID=A0A4C1Y7F4_EUMVA|nr:hypothetical protein EVAR_45642_1 [Eumeta japonica]
MLLSRRKRPLRKTRPKTGSARVNERRRALRPRPGSSPDDVSALIDVNISRFISLRVNESCRPQSRHVGDAMPGQLLQRLAAADSFTKLARVANDT